MANGHGKPCAARWRHAAEDGNWPASRLVNEIAQCCGVTRLRAHRLAHGWTLTQAVGEFHAMCAAEGINGPRLDVDQLRVWETNPRRRPQASTIDLLCRLYRTNTGDLGLEVAGDYSLPSPRTKSAETQVVQPLHGDSGDWLDAVRHTVDRTLASATVTPVQLDLLDERLLVHRRQYLIQPPKKMLMDLVADLREVHALASERQPAAVQTRLSEMTAVLATLIADSLMKLGQQRQADAWYATARTAADDSGSLDLRARVRIQAAMLPYYYGPLDRTLRLTQEARLLTQSGATVTGAFAAAAEARARARRGDASGAEKAMRIAQEVFTNADHPTAADDAWAFPERRLLLYLSGALTYLGQTRRAREVQSRARLLYRDHAASIDPALLLIEEAICLAHERHLAEACQMAGQAYLNVAPAHRTQILEARARNVIDVMPKAMRAACSVRELGEILELPASQM